MALLRKRVLISGLVLAGLYTKKKMKIQALLLFLMLSSIGYSQPSEESATEKIQALKKGFLLVRLKTGDLQAKALERAGSKAEAAIYLQKRNEENKVIVQAFTMHFRFCPVYFCYSSASDTIKQGYFKGMLLNSSLQADTSLVPTASYFLTAEFGFTDVQQREGLIMMDRNFNQLNSPFPFLVTRYEGVAKKRTQEEMIIRLDQQLMAFYEKK